MTLAGRPRARARHPARLGAARSPRACCRTASPTPASSPSTTRSTPRSGTSSRRTSSSRRRASSARARDRRRRCAPRVGQIVAGYRAGTRYGIRMDEDGLLAAGVPGVQLTWMDAKVGDRVVTPRIGKPVEVQALWLNALRDRGRIRARVLRALPPRARLVPAALLERAARLPVRRGRRRSRARPQRSGSLRPNQILAVGGLPYQVLVEPYASRVVETVERELLTPLGLRSLAPGEPGYRPHYGGGVLGARSRLSPGHRLAVADRAVRRGLAARARRHAGGEARGGRALPVAAARASRASPGSATSPRSPTPSRRTGRAAARSRPGRSASCCARAAWSRTNPQRRSRSAAQPRARAASDRQRQGEAPCC